MNFPDPVVILRPLAQDEYGNPSNDWAYPSATEAKGFLATPEMLLLPPSTDVRRGDRVEVGGRVYTADPVLARSPGAPKMWTVTLSETLEG